ncbi:MAG: ABC transporter substrate-binding protein [Rudaea sp.]
MRHIHWLSLMAAALLVIALAACGGGGTTPQPTTAAPPTQPTAAAAQPTMAEQPTTAAQPTAEQPTAAAEQPTAAAAASPTATSIPITHNQGTPIQLLGWASSTAEDTLLSQIISGYNTSQAKYDASFNPVPNYDQSLQTALAGGSPPDVFYIDSLKFPDFVKNGVLATPPSGAIEDPSDFYPSLAAAFTSNGTLYCPPKDFSTLGLVYNKKMLDAAGIKPPTTWDELKTAAQKLTDKSKGVYGLVLPADAARWTAFLYQAGGHVLDSSGKMDIDTPEAKKALDYYLAFFTDGSAVLPDKVDSGWPGEAFGKEKAAMVVEGNWIVPFLKQSYPDVSYGIAELPAGTKKATLAFTVCYGVPKAAKNADGSWNLVNALTSKAGMQQWTDLGLAMPTRQSLKDHGSGKFPDLAAYLAGASYAQAWSFGPGFSAVFDTFNKGMQGAIGGQETSDQILKDTQKAGEEAVNP